MSGTPPVSRLPGRRGWPGTQARREVRGRAPAPPSTFFFFSSRRRHTRSLRDWSSDVCSSDLCLGVQLLARAAHSWVGPLAEPEIGWYEVELTAAGGADPVLGGLPERFEAFQWHYYTYGIPGGAQELARSERCTQAFRLGERVWGVQFHPEVTLA